MNPFAFLNKYLTNDSAFKMLNHFDISRFDDLTSGWNYLIHFGGHHPDKAHQSHQKKCNLSANLSDTSAARFIHSGIADSLGVDQNLFQWFHEISFPAALLELGVK